MAAPFSKHALDFLDPDPEAVRLVTDFLGAIVNFPDEHINRFMVHPVWIGPPMKRVGHEYFLGEKRGSSMIENPRTLRSDITGLLRKEGWIEVDAASTSRRNWQKFTPKAIAWYETHSGPSDDIVRRAIGRAVADAQPDGLAPVQFDVIAEHLGVNPDRVRQEAQILVDLYVLSRTDASAPLRIDSLAGAYWRATGFGPISRLPPELLRPPTEVSLFAVPTLVRPLAALHTPAGRTAPYDLFLSYSSEDEADVARPLADVLIAAGLDIWYAELRLRIGDSLRRSIDEGIANSRFAVVVLSESYLEKGWTNYEFDGVVTRAVSGEQVILPIWHNISKSQVIDFSPSLADKVARKTAQHTIEEIAAEIIQRIRDSP